MVDDIIDFMFDGGYPVIFPEDFGEYECPKCRYFTKEGDKFEWVEEDKIFKCPECGEGIQILK